MEVKLDALVAEMVETIDSNLLVLNPDFETAWRPNRVHLILIFLGGCDIADPTKSKGFLRWRPARRLDNHIGVKDHGISDVLERTEWPTAISALAEKYSESLDNNSEEAVESAFYVMRQFAMYKMGLLEYRGRSDNRCQFERSSNRVLVEDEDGNTADFVEKYLV